MARTYLQLLFLLTSTLGGCDSSAEFEDCVPSDTPGARRNACPSSVFVAEDSRGREIHGVVRRGEDVVPGAMVRVEPSAGLLSGSSAAPLSTLTDAVGVYTGLRNVAFRYDLSVRYDLPSAPSQELLVYRGIAGRYLEPSIEGPRTLARSWTSHVDVIVNRSVPPERSLAFFDGIYSVAGDLMSGLTIRSSTFSRKAKIQVLEYETAGGLAKATAYGTVDVLVEAGARRGVNLELKEIKPPPNGFPTPSFSVNVPPGFTPSPIELRFSFAPPRTAEVPLASIPVGTTVPVPIIPDATLYTYRLRATSPDGVVLDSGETPFDLLLPVTTIELPEPVTVVAPLAGEIRRAGEKLVASGNGVFEHVLVPQAGGASLRIISDQKETALPDVTTLGVAPLAGPYTWTVRSYPNVKFVEDLGGLDTRRFKAMSESAPRSIVLRATQKGAAYRRGGARP